MYWTEWRHPYWSSYASWSTSPRFPCWNSVNHSFWPSMFSLAQTHWLLLSSTLFYCDIWNIYNINWFQFCFDRWLVRQYSCCGWCRENKSEEIACEKKRPQSTDEWERVCHDERRRLSDTFHTAPTGVRPGVNLVLGLPLKLTRGQINLSLGSHSPFRPPTPQNARTRA